MFYFFVQKWDRLSYPTPTFIIEPYYRGTKYPDKYSLRLAQAAVAAMRSLGIGKARAVARLVVPGSGAEW